ncbi:MAG: phage major capsid protein [Clostridiales bacterium]|nr:phage major capsid protein [Clostridiales bacterium]
MVDLSTAQNALKDAYLSVACNQLNTQTNPLLAKIKQSSSDVYGKQIIKMAPVGLNGGIGAGSETGLLPTANENNYVQFKTTLKNLYGTIEISDKAIRASANNSGAFVDLLNAEMEGLLTASKFNLGRMLYGDGSGAVGTVTAVESGVVTMDSVKNLMEGMVVDAFAGNVAHDAGLRISYVDRGAKKVYFTTTPSSIAESDVLYVQGSKGNEITGLGAIFGNSATLYGLNRANNKWLTPYTSTDSKEINDTLLQTAVDFLEENTGSKIDFITCGAGVKRAYQEYLACYRRNIDVANLEGGYKAISFNGIPVVSDRFIADDTLYMLDTSKFTMHQLCDWEWIEGEGGKILRQKAGYPAYTATLVKYADLICEQPNGQAKFSNILTTVTNPFSN